MSWAKRWTGLDTFDLVIHFVITGFAAGMLSELAGPGRNEDAAVLAVCLVSTLVLAWRRARALKKAAGATPDRMTELEGRVAELEDLLVSGGGSLDGRLVELEERLDFAERMLAQQRERDRLPAGREEP